MLLAAYVTYLDGEKGFAWASIMLFSSFLSLILFLLMCIKRWKN
jgi:hypothetical protein